VKASPAERAASRPGRSAVGRYNKVEEERKNDERKKEGNVEKKEEAKTEEGKKEERRRKDASNYSIGSRANNAQL
jgi:hypothetical protein